MNNNDKMSSNDNRRQKELVYQRDLLQLQYRHKLDMLERPGAQIVYRNQEEAAQQIIQEFMNGKVWVVLVAPPGSGKTGVILEVLRQLGQHPDPAHQIHINDMVIMTGMSDTDWIRTMRDGMLDALHNTVYHRAMLHKKDGIDVMRNGIIITDECHVACQSNQTIDKKLKEAGLKNIDSLRARNMRMLEVSATPEGVLADISKWSEYQSLVILKPDDKYKGFQTMKSENRLHNSKDFDLEKYEDAKKLLQLFDDRYKNSVEKKYFAFRIASETARGNLRTACMELGWATPQNHDSKDRIEDIDAVMENAPREHQPIIVKGFWRASKRLVRKHVGGTYECPTVRSDDTAKSQGLTARFCNTFEWEGEQKNVEFRPLHFDDVESIDRYIEWWNNGCSYPETEYKAPRLRSDGEGKVLNPKTKVHPDTISGISVIEEDPITLARNPKNVPIVLTVTEAEYQTMKRIDGSNDPGVEWDYQTIRSVILNYDRELVSRIDRILTQGGKDMIVEVSPKTYYKYIEAFVNASINNKRHHHVGNIKDKKKDTFQIYLDKKDHRIVVNIYNGSRISPTTTPTT